MALPIRFDNTVFQAGFFGTDDGGVPTNATRSFRIDDVYDFPVTVNGTVTDSNSTVTLTYTLPGASAPTTQTLNATSLDNPNMILFTGSGTPGNLNGTANRYVFSNTQLFGSGNPNRSTFADDGDNTLGNYAPVCFTTGTVIRTSRGDVAVEDLQVGDRAVTASGEHRPIRWIGSRRTNCRRHPDPAAVMPVRIRAGALGENQPSRDLVVSPGHSIAVTVLEEVLIPASVLVNGSTIVREEVDSVTYWHVELDSHDLLVAEGQPSESYLDMGNRDFFAGGTRVSFGGRPDADAASRTHADFCRPFHDGGAVVEAVRAQVQVRAEALGWTLAAAETWADVHLEVDGRIVCPEGSNLSARFTLPSDARDVWLVSPVAVPCLVGQGEDVRALGLCLSALSLSDERSEARTVALDDPLLCVGFHTMSPGHRWTAGRARLPAALLSGLHGEAVLHLDLALPALPRWVAPRVEGAPLKQAAGSTPSLIAA